MIIVISEAFGAMVCTARGAIALAVTVPLSGWHRRFRQRDRAVTMSGAERAQSSASIRESPDDVAALLKTGKQGPLLVLRRTSRLADGRTCESTLFHIRPERFDLVVRSGVEARFIAYGAPSVENHGDGAAR
ncbi:hypothetical protein ABIC49_001793 [Burkholderia ambifaria]